MKKPWKIAAYIVGGVIGIWLTAKLLLPIGLPFLFGYLLARLAIPPERFLHARARFPQRLASFLSVTLISAILFGVLWLLGRAAFAGLERLAHRLPSILQSLEQPLQTLHARLLQLTAKLPDSLAPAAAEWIDRLFEGGSVIAGTVSEKLLSLAGGVLSCLPDCFLFILTTLLSAYLIAAEREMLRELLQRHLPSGWLSRWGTIKARLKSALSGYIKAQGLLLIVVFAVIAVGLLLLRKHGALLLALIIAVVDALPVFGAGTVLIPWAVITFLRGNITLAVGFLLLYAVVSVLRSLLEPRFLGRQIGLNPLLTLFALYAGFRLFGVLGMILVPVGVILLKQLYDLLEPS